MEREKERERDGTCLSFSAPLSLTDCCCRFCCRRLPLPFPPLSHSIRTPRRGNIHTEITGRLLLLPMIMKKYVLGSLRAFPVFSSPSLLFLQPHTHAGTQDGTD